MRRYGSLTDWQYLCEHDWLDTIEWCLRHSCSFHISVDKRYNERKQRDEVIMARKKDSSGQGSIGDWNGIANISISSEHKDKAVELLSGDDTAWESDIEDMVGSDYKFVIRWDDRSDCPYLSVSCYASDDPNFKYSLVTRAPSWKACFALFWVKHFEIANRDWTRDTVSDSWG